MSTSNKTLDITSRDGTITYHVKPTDRVRLKRSRTWYFVRDGEDARHNTLLLYTSFTDAQQGNANWEQFCSREFFCQNVKEVKPSLESEANET